MFDLKSFPDAVEKTGWTGWITKFLSTARELIVQRLSEGKCLVLMNAAGNVTNTLSSLSQIIIDPNFRTLNGFVYLIHKDWVAYGLSAPKQFPIFAHFIHCVFELFVQQPFAFEFNQVLLPYFILFYHILSYFLSNGCNRTSCFSCAIRWRQECWR